MTHSALTAVVLGSALTLSGCCGPMMYSARRSDPQASATVSAGEPASQSAAEAQDITIRVSDGFSPDTVHVRRGTPVRLHFYRDDKPTCATSIVIPELDIRRELPPGQDVVIAFTPAKEGVLTFACGTGMYSGTMVVG